MPGELAGVAGVVRDLVLPGVEASRGRVSVPENARAITIAAIANREPTLVLASSSSQSQALFEELQLFVAGIPLYRLPEAERLPYELARSDTAYEIEVSRALRVLSGDEPGIVVSSWVAASERRAGLADASSVITVTSGQELSPSALATLLEGGGYEAEHLADRQGLFARRGGIIDVFPANAPSPYRIEFFGNDVESIRELDLATQRSRGRADTLAIAPMPTGARHAQAAAAELVEQIEVTGDPSEAFLEQLELVASGHRSEFDASLAPLLYETSAVHMLHRDVRIIFDDAREGRLALGRAYDHHDRARSELEYKGAIPRGLPPLLADPTEIEQLLSDHPNTLAIERFGTQELGATRLPLKAAPAFAGKLKPLVQQLGAWKKAGKTVIVSSQQALRLAELLDEDGVKANLTRGLEGPPETGTLTLLPIAVAGGFLGGDDFMLVTDSEIFGFRKRRRPTRPQATVKRDLVATLEVGDHLVHADHGIARFGGLIRRTVDGVEKEYLELQYAEGDRLYVPADQLDSISPYIGPADSTPSLTRLGSGEWTRTKRRVRQAVLEIASELLELYAKREFVEGHAYPPDGPWQMEMEAAFPFVETQDQLDAIAAVKADMERPRPMDRLICGDVGYGKTEVAIRAAFKAVSNGKQVAVLVPTTVLAEQHGQTFRERLAGFPVRIEVLSRFRSDQQLREINEAIAKGEVDIAVGTHRILQKDVNFKDLGLVVVDEEQRFGVTHKERLKQMRSEVDVLTLSATPIPRTLQMSLVGIRDMSTVMTPPEERLPTRTYVTAWDDEIIREAIDREMQRGGQVYFVHNRVHDIERVKMRLNRIVPEADAIIGHGQMPEDQLERVMLEFGAGDHDILICTTIIENGLDIPNANTIIIDNANQLGLGQLYQLRGRVGRSSHRAYAYLLYDKDRSLTEPAQRRLEAIFEASELGSGFQIALRDLEIRGAGNLLGSEQSGHIASVGFDLYSKLMAEAVDALKQMKTEEPSRPKLPPVPSIDLPLTAHVPEQYLEDLNERLALYQRISSIDSAAGVASMQEELRDRFGPVPPSVENLLYISLVKSLGRRAQVEAIKTDEHMIHLYVRGGTTDDQRLNVKALKYGEQVLVGPNQVRIDRIGAGANWQQWVVKLLTAMRIRA